MSALTGFSLPMPDRSAEVSDQVAASLSEFVCWVQAHASRFRFENPRRWHGEIVRRWCRYLDATGRTDLASGDSELRAWMAVAVPEAVEWWLPAIADKWKRAAAPGSYALEEYASPTEPSLRTVVAQPFVLTERQARIVNDARLHALRSVNGFSDRLRQFDVIETPIPDGREPALQPFMPAPWEASAAAEFAVHVQGRAPHGIPAHLLIRYAVQVADEAVVRRHVWLDGTPAVPNEEIR